MLRTCEIEKKDYIRKDNQRDALVDWGWGPSSLVDQSIKEKLHNKFEKN